MWYDLGPVRDFFDSSLLHQYPQNSNSKTSKLTKDKSEVKYGQDIVLSLMLNINFKHLLFTSDIGTKPIKLEVSHTETSKLPPGSCSN